MKKVTNNGVVVNSADEVIVGEYECEGEYNEEAERAAFMAAVMDWYYFYY